MVKKGAPSLIKPVFTSRVGIMARNKERENHMVWPAGFSTIRTLSVVCKGRNRHWRFFRPSIMYLVVQILLTLLMRSKTRNITKWLQVYTSAATCSFKFKPVVVTRVYKSCSADRFLVDLVSGISSYPILYNLPRSGSDERSDTPILFVEQTDRLVSGQISQTVPRFKLAMILSACLNGKCRCWCSFLGVESQHELKLKSDQTPVSSRLADLVASNDVPSDIDSKLC